MEQTDEPTFSCRICGRKFIKSSLSKHEPVCKKLNNLNRKPFDSGKQRAAGSDVPYSDIKKAAKEKEKMGGVFPRPHTQWRQRHEHFIDAVSASKKVDYAIKTGAPLPPPPRTAVPSDYVQCEYCGRNFNERAAERHIPFCRDQHKKSGKPMVKPPPAKMSSRDASPSRGRAETRGSSGRSDDMTTRRRSMDSRQASGERERPPPARSTAQSATMNRQGIPPTPKTRSTSAPRTASRLKQPPTRGETRGETRGQGRANSRAETRDDYRTPSRRSNSRSRRS